MSPRIAHVVNPVIVPPESDLFIAQPVTFESMRRAAECARGAAEVTLCAACYPQDEPLVPDGFLRTPLLERSALDFGRFEKQRKLPLVGDILQRLYEASDAELLVFTNVDIGVQPYFYQTVAALAEQGLDAFIINRRTIAAEHAGQRDLALMYADLGTPHPGYDCFVFHRSLVPSLRLRNVVVGMTGIGMVLAGNLMRVAANFRIFEDLHLTFHIGDERSWRSVEFSDYEDFNLRQAWEILCGLERDFALFTNADPGWVRHALRQLKERYDPACRPPQRGLTARLLRKLGARK